MPTLHPPIQRARQFAQSLSCVVRETLSRLPEREVILFLDAIHDTLEFELWIQRMELESVGCPAPDELESV
jgi:hypothetical protein